MHLIILLFSLNFIPLMVMENYSKTHSGMYIATEKGLFQDKKLVVIAFGNSITATRNTIQQVYAQRLPDILGKRGVMAEVINAGIPGSHSGSIKDHALFKIQHGRDRFEAEVLARNPDLVIIGFGTNDAHIDGPDPDGPSRIPLRKFKQNLIYMIKALQKKEIKVVLLAPNALGEKFPGYQNERLMQYVNAVRTLSTIYQTGLVDNFKLLMEFSKNSEGYLDDLLLDGIHPNDRGHQLMAEELSKEIVRIYK